MKLERTITGHGNTICKLVVEGNLLFSGSYTEIKARTSAPRSIAGRVTIGRRPCRPHHRRRR